jgi:hypothetical protein
MEYYDHNKKNNMFVQVKEKTNVTTIKKKMGQIQKMTIKKHLKIQNLENKTSFDKKKKIRENGQKELIWYKIQFR